MQIITPGLYLVSTPIGNMEDITFRALNVLKNSDVILCEDTRRSKKLLTHYNIKKKLLPYHKFNEKKIAKQITKLIKDNKIISLISDAGSPGISDPGAVLVNECLLDNLKVHPIPGPSAITSAVSASGLNDQYLFYGFLTKKENELKNVLKNLSNLNYSIVFFIPAVKINFYLPHFKKYFLNRKIFIAKEMTKVHEEFIKKDLASIKNLPENFKGELTVILSGKISEKNHKKEIDESVKVEIKEMLKKYSHKDVVDFISKKENLSKKIVYDYSLKLKK
tara:strand:+ start:316 stop:1149 length:834 start_codon:yes stop_codon:yes gene_type:complete